MTDNADSHILELLRWMRAEHNARFDRIDATLAEVLTPTARPRHPHR